MNYGFVYLLMHSYMPGVCKIGKTERPPHQRAAELSSSTGVPGPFQVVCYVEVEDPDAVELEFHGYLHAIRITPGREFFRHGDLEQFVAGLFMHYPDRLAFADCCIEEFAEASTSQIQSPYDEHGKPRSPFLLEPMEELDDLAF